MRNTDEFWDDLLSGDTQDQIRKIAEFTAGISASTGPLYRLREIQIVKEIKRQRILAGMSQKELASRMSALGFDMKQSTIAKLENEKRPLRMAEYFAIAGILNVTELALLTSTMSQDEERQPDLAGRLIEIELEAKEHARAAMLEAIEVFATRYAEAESTIHWLAGEARIAAADSLADRRGPNATQE